MQIFSKTDRGGVRTDNQDAYFAGKITDDSVFAVVCDGMGGANAGNVASELAVRHISEYVIRSYRDGMDMTDTEKTLKNAIVSANISLYDKAVNNAADFFPVTFSDRFSDHNRRSGSNRDYNHFQILKKCCRHRVRRNRISGKMSENRRLHRNRD